MKNLIYLYVKKIKLLVFKFILNKILLFIFSKKNQLCFYDDVNIHIFIKYTKITHTHTHTHIYIYIYIYNIIFYFITVLLLIFY